VAGGPYSEAMLPLWRALRLVVVGPIAVLALLVTALMVSTVAGTALPEPWLFALWSLATVGAAVLLARSGRWWALPGAGLMQQVLAVTVPAFLLLLLMYPLAGSAEELPRHAPGYALFFGGLLVVLPVAARLAAAGRRVAAWWAGGLGALFLADAAVALTVARGGLDPAYAPAWLFVALTDSGLGLMPDWDKYRVLDIVELDPPLYIGFAGLALGVVLARRTSGDNSAPIAALH
jgi:hypothetical protein